MKKVLALLIVLSVSLVYFGACSREETSSHQEENSSVVVKKTFARYYLVETGQSETGETIITGDFSHSLSNFGLSVTNKQRIQDPLLIGKSKKPFSTGINFTYAYTEVFIDKNQDPVPFYGSYDVYRNKANELMYLKGTDTLGFLFRTFDSKLSNGKGISEDKAKTVAEEFLKTIMPEEKFSQFTRVKVAPVQINRVPFIYVRHIEGYETDEFLSVMVHPCGEVSSYNGMNLYKYDTLESKIKKEDVEQAERELRAHVDRLNLKNAEQGSVTIVTNSQGKLFLRLFVEHDMDSNDRTYSTISQFYTNLEAVEPLA